MNDNELYHYGVLGMKWGRTRSNKKASDAYDKMRADKKQYKQALKSNKGNFGMGIKAVQKLEKNKKKINDAAFEVISSKAAYKAANQKTKQKADKAELKTYRKAMQKSGIRGSTSDYQHGGRSTKLYDKIKIKKGKAYADKIEKKVQNVAIAQMATGATLAIGSAFVSKYLQRKGY